MVPFQMAQILEKVQILMLLMVVGFNALSPERIMKLNGPMVPKDQINFPEWVSLVVALLWTLKINWQYSSHGMALYWVS
jgi:hypothetical protein